MRLSSWQKLRVVDENGVSLGRLFDLRCRGAPVNEQSRERAEATTLVYGTVGLLERLGIRTARECEARWGDVIAMRDGKLVVRAQSGAPRRE